MNPFDDPVGTLGSLVCVGGISERVVTISGLLFDQGFSWIAFWDVLGLIKSFRRFASWGGIRKLGFRFHSSGCIRSGIGIRVEQCIRGVLGFGFGVLG